MERRRPLLFEVGDLMEVECSSDEQQGLFWARESPVTGWEEQRINITKVSLILQCLKN